MKIRINSERCKGHQNCVRAAPELFVVGEDGFARLRDSREVPQELKAKALIAWDNCPEFAIEIEEPDAGVRPMDAS